MSTNPPSRGSGQSIPSLIKIHAEEKTSTSDVNGEILQGVRRPVPGTLGDKALAFNEIQLALSNISSNLGKLVPVERQHVVPPAIAAFVHLIFLMLIRQSIENVISAVFFILLLTSFAWPMWSTLKLMNHQLDAIDVKMDILQHSFTSVELAASRCPTVGYAAVRGNSRASIALGEVPGTPARQTALAPVEDILARSYSSRDQGKAAVPIVHPVLNTVDEAPPQWETLERNAQPIEPREAPHPVKRDESPVNVEESDDILEQIEKNFSIRLDPSAILSQTDPTSAALEPRASDIPPVTADNPNPAPTPAGPGVQDEQNVNKPTVSVSSVPPEPVVRVEQAIHRPEPSFDHRSSTLLEIKQRIELLASGSLQRLPHSNQREPVDLVSLRRIALRLLMYCASLSTADFAFPNGFLGPPDSVPYYPTGDLEGDRNVAFTTALDCIDELMILLTGSRKAEIAAALSELAQALSDLGLHEYASSVSSFALEILRDLYAVEPDRFRSRIASVQSLRANIFVDLRQNDDAAVAAEEAVTILKNNEISQTELVYAMLNYAVLLGSIGRGEGAAAVAFELMGFFEDPIQPDLVLVSSLCELCVSNACIEFDIDLALSEAEKAIESSRATLDENSKVVLAGALLTKSKILSSKGQNDHAYAISAEAVTLFRSASVDRHTFSLLLAHALDTHAHQLSEANRRVESFPIISEAVELWQALQISAPVATKRPLAWALFELAKYRHQDADKQRLRNELQIAESAVSTFRDVKPLDYAGLADALYLCGKRMLELDNSSDAATYAEESIQYFREARNTLGLVSSLSLASSCLACTERKEDALKYAKEAVEVHRERQDDGDAEYYDLLRKLLADVVHCFTEMGRRQDALPWMQELEQLGMPGDTGNSTGQLTHLGGKLQPKNDTETREQTGSWTDTSNSAPKLNISSVGARPPTSTFTPAPGPALQLDKGKGKEVYPSTEPSSSAPRADRDKAKEVIPGNPFSPSSNAPRLSLREEILSPTAAAQHQRDALAGMGGSYGSGNNMSSLLGGPGGPIRSGNEDPLSGLLGMGSMGGRTLGGASGPSNNDLLSGLGGMGSMGGRTMPTPSSPLSTGLTGRPLGSPIQQTARAPPPSGRAGGGRMSGMAGLESLLGGLGGLGPGGGLGGLGRMGRGGFDPGLFGPEFFGPGSDEDKADGTTGTGTDGGGDDTPRSGTWSGTGIQTNLRDVSA